MSASTIDLDGGGGGGGPLRITVFTGSGTWIRSPDVGSVLVKVIGGGGGTGTPNGSYSYLGPAGGSSSFGSHCFAGGGTGGRGANTTVPYGAPGTGSLGDINLTGMSGTAILNYRAPSPMPHFGLGSQTFSSTQTGGGAGGYSEKLINSNSLGSSETVTVGAGGDPGSSYSGNSGAVIVYEYGL